MQILEKKEDVWRQLEKGKVTTFIEKLHGHKQHVTERFYKEWEGNKVNLFGRQFTINAEVITEITGLPNEGMKFFKQKKVAEEVVRKFPKNDQEENDLEKVGNFYDLD